MRKKNRIVQFVVLFLFLSLFVSLAYSGDFKLIKVNSHYEPEISEGIILPETNIKAGIFTYIIDKTKNEKTSKAGLLVNGKILYYVESEKYAHIQPKNWLEYTGTFDPGGDPNFGIFKNYFAMDASSFGASHNRKMFLFRFNKDTVKLLDVLVKAYGGFSMDFMSAYEETDKVVPVGEIPRIYKKNHVSWIDIKDLDRDSNPEFKIKIYQLHHIDPEYELSKFELYLEIANERLQVDLNPELYKPLFEREKLKKSKRKSDAYYIYGFLAKELELKKIKTMLERSGKKPYEQYGRVVNLLENHKKWNSAFHDYGDEKFVLKQYNLKMR